VCWSKGETKERVTVEMKQRVVEQIEGTSVEKCWNERINERAETAEEGAGEEEEDIRRVWSEVKYEGGKAGEIKEEEGGRSGEEQVEPRCTQPQPPARSSLASRFSLLAPLAFSCTAGQNTQHATNGRRRDVAAMASGLSLLAVSYMSALGTDSTLLLSTGALAQSLDRALRPVEMANAVPGKVPSRNRF